MIREYRSILLSAVAVGLCTLLALAPHCRAGLEIHIIDVAQGDCTLIVSPTGGTFLFDAGTNGKGNTVVYPYMQSLGLDALDYIGASHYHMDHIGGIDDVVDNIGIDSVRVAVLDRGWSYTTQTYQDYASTVAAKRTTITDGQVIDLGGGVSITCLGVNGNGELSPPFEDSYDENDLCVSLLVEYGDFDFFVAGDLSGVNSSYYNDIESSIAPEAGDVDIYRVDHHGSSSNSNTTLVSTLSPEVSIISVGNNSYGHPTQTVINRLISYDSYIYQTELGDGGTIPPGDGEVVNGHIVIEVDGGQYTVNGDVYQMGSSGVEIVQEPSAFRAFPNPFIRETTFRLSIPAGQKARVEVFDVKGRLVNAFGMPSSADGICVIGWDGRSARGETVTPGVYFVRIAGPAVSLSQKVVKR
jgi:beta-lactamase superfamily II metal-dependent hydrolase